MQTTVDHGLIPSQVQKIKSIVSPPAPEANLNWKNNTAN